MWNEANFRRLDQEMIHQSKDDDDTGSDKDKHPKGFEKFFKKKEQREKEQTCITGGAENIKAAIATVTIESIRITRLAYIKRKRN